MNRENTSDRQGSRKGGFTLKSAAMKPRAGQFRLLTNLFRLAMIVTICLGGFTSFGVVEAQELVVDVPETPGSQPTSSFYPRITGSASAGVSYVAYSGDGSELAVGTPAGIEVYSETNEEPRLTLRTQTAVTSLAYSPSTNIIASGSSTGHIRLWNTLNGAPVSDLGAPQGTVNDLAFSPDGTILASAGSDGVVRLWLVSDGHLMGLLNGHTGAVSHVSFAPDGLSVASGGTDGSVKVWRISDGLATATLQGAVGGVSGLDFSPDGATVAFGTADGLVWLWEISSGNQPQSYPGHKAGTTTVAFSPDGTTLFSASQDGTVIARLVEDGTVVRRLQNTTKAAASLAVSPDGLTLATGSFDGMVSLWSVRVSAPNDDASFVADVTIPDHAVIEPGTLFNKTWRLKNTGTSQWTTAYTLVFVSGDKMDAPASQSVPDTEPGGLADITVPMSAPTTLGIYKSVWQLSNAQGQFFGPQFTVIIQVGTSATATPTTTAGYRADISASSTQIDAGGWVTIRAYVENVQAAWLDGNVLTGNTQEKTVQLCSDTSFTLEVLLTNGQREYRSVTVWVNGNCNNDERHVYIEDLSADDTTPLVGQVVRFTARIENDKDDDVSGVDVLWRPRESASYDVVANDIHIDKHDSVNISWKHTFASSGTFKTKARVEHDDESYSKTLSIEVASTVTPTPTQPPVYPDLVITSLTADDTTPDVGQTVHFTAVVRNQGTGAAHNARFVWRPSPTTPFLLQANGLTIRAGADQTILFQYTWAESGTFETQAVIGFDEDQTLLSSADSNFRTLQIIVGSGGTPTPGPTPTPQVGNPNPVISSLRADDDTPVVGQEVQFTVVVKNEGDGRAENLRVVWQSEAGAPFELKADGVTLEPGAEERVRFAHTYNTEGTYATQAVVSFNSATTLAVSVNTNARSLTITVGPGTSKVVATTEATVGQQVAPPLPTATPTPSGEEKPIAEPPAVEEPAPTQEPVAQPPAVEEPAPTQEPVAQPPAVEKPTPTPRPAAKQRTVEKPTPTPRPTAKLRTVEKPAPTPRPTAKLRTVEKPTPTPKPTAKLRTVEKPTPTPKLVTKQRNVEKPTPTPKPVTKQPAVEKPAPTPVEGPSPTPTPILPLQNLTG